MYIFLAIVGGISCFAAAWKRLLTLHERDLKRLRAQLSSSLDYEANELKQQYVKAIDDIFAEYYQNKNV